MMEAKKKESSHWWWFDSHNKGNSNRSPWLQTTLAELNEKTIKMLKLIEEDADSFAQRAEMYYKKRPELITMVEDFYRTHRSLAERFDQAKSDPSSRHLSSPWSSPSPFTKYRLEKSTSLNNDKAYDSYSEAYGPDESDQSEVDDPEVEEEEEEETLLDPILLNPLDSEESSGGGNEEVVRLKEEVARLREENEAMREKLREKDEEKREVIRQLSLAMDLLREENVKVRDCFAMKTPKKEDYKLNGTFLGRLFDGFGKTPTNLVAL